ncbi:tetratricopeptide repeat protein [Ochrovirga pacifica]|uniref:tetratricopeptide repeat protein n=1 Tax=Ochrovirga pacifica TaxID=1042376 RepID=UPI0002F75545|nr:tetratricopeptide repeat protein [Ochrovirga pacifica]
MKQALQLILVLTSCIALGQNLPKEKVYEAKKQLREGNKAYKKGSYDDAAIAYQKSLVEDGMYYKGAYNLGNSFFKQKKYKEAVDQFLLANKLAKSKENKAKTSELIGDAFIKQKELEKGLEAYKQALLKNPTDDILRQKYIAAKQEKEQQDQQQKDQDKDKNNQDNKDQNKDQKDKGNDQKGQNKDDDKENSQDSKNGEDKQDQEDSKPSDQEQNKGENGEDKKQPQAQPKPSKLSPEQIQQLLESMSNEEEKTQKKVNAQKAKAKVKNNEKDW